MDPVHLKNHILHQNIQAIVLDENGEVLASDDTLIQIDPATRILKDDGVFIGLEEVISALETDEEFKLDCIETEFYGRHSIYDFLVKRVADENSKKRFLLLIYDLEDVYKKVIDLRRERNEVTIYAEKLALAHKELKQTQLQLVSSEKMAAIGLLAAGMSHEINNPLNYIFSGVELIKRALDEANTDSEKVLEMLSYIETGATRIKGVVNNLKVFDSSGHDEEKIIDVHEAIDQTLHLVKYRFQENTEISRKYASERIQIKCSPGKLIQVLFNLLINSATFTSNISDPHIEVGTTKIEDRLLVFIKDNGVGISTEIQKKVFDPYFTTKKMGTGKGLGLSVAQIITKEHGGKLSFESEVGVGTTFFLELPIK